MYKKMDPSIFFELEMNVGYCLSTDWSMTGQRWLVPTLRRRWEENDTCEKYEPQL